MVAGRSCKTPANPREHTGHETRISCTRPFRGRTRFAGRRGPPDGMGLALHANMASFVGRAALALAGVLAACQGDPVELPEGWAGAAPLALQQTACGGDPYTVPPRPRLELTTAGGQLTGIYRDAQFRCGDQRLCGHRLEPDETTRVLVQPCDLHPAVVPRCDCLYQVSFTLPGRPGRGAVELHSRRDLYGAQGPVPAILVDRQPVPGPSAGVARPSHEPRAR